MVRCPNCKRNVVTNVTNNTNNSKDFCCPFCGVKLISTPRELEEKPNRDMGSETFEWFVTRMNEMGTSDRLLARISFFLDITICTAICMATLNQGE